MKPPGGEPFHLSGTFLAVDPPGRLVYTFNWDEPAADDRETLVTLTLDAHDGGTRLSLSQGRFATEERLVLHRDGWTDSFEKLREVLRRSRLTGPTAGRALREWFPGRPLRPIAPPLPGTRTGQEAAVEGMLSGLSRGPDRHAHALMLSRPSRAGSRGQRGRQPCGGAAGSIE